MASAVAVCPGMQSSWVIDGPADSPVVVDLVDVVLAVAVAVALAVAVAYVVGRGVAESVGEAVAVAGGAGLMELAVLSLLLLLKARSSPLTNTPVVGWHIIPIALVIRHHSVSCKPRQKQTNTRWSRDELHRLFFALTQALQGGR